MKKVIAVTFAAALLSTSALAFAAEKEIPVDRVILSTSGLANFVHQMEVKDNAKVEFPVRFEQVDDILKSLVIFDEKGRLGGVTLPGKEPLAQVFKDLPFTQAQLQNPMLLLNAYQGAVVTATGNSSSMTGKIVQVKPEVIVTEDGTRVTKHRLSLMTADGLRQAVLEDLQSLNFENEKIRGEIARALEAIRENGSAERRMLTVSLPGEGTRPVTLSYVVDAPLWKTAYRMVIPEQGAAEQKGLLQGWAIVENMTASDWNNVDMTLVSGNPVTFKQALYESYYVPREEIPVQVFGRVMPRTDHGAISARGDDMAEAMPMPAAAPAAKRMRAQSLGRATLEMDSSADFMAGAPASPEEMVSYGGRGTMAQAANAAESAEATTQVLFRFPDRFTVKSGQSMMLPFVSREVPMERIALYQPETHPRHPLASVEIKNDGNTGLPPGVLTLYEESKLLKGTSFVGDASLAVVPVNDKRMISYALDSKTTVDRDVKSTSQEGRITVSKGIIRTAHTNRMETVYTIKAPEKEDRILVIEHPRQGDYNLVEPKSKDVEMTETHYRLRVPLKAGESKTLSVVMERENFSSYSIINLSQAQLASYASTRGQLDKDARRIFAKLASARAAIDEVDTKVREIERQKQSIFRDQDRVRENLRSLSGTSDIQQKYLRKLNEQEDQVTKLDQMLEKLAAERVQREQALKDMILEVEL